MIQSRSFDRYATNEAGITLACRTAPPQTDPACLVILGHGSTADSIFAQGSEEPSPDSIRKLADSRNVLFTADWGSTTHWGNDTSVTRAGQGKTYVQGSTSPTQAKAGKVSIFAKSMGTLAALNFARANPTLVSAIAAMWPAVDLADLYTNNRGGYAAEISSTYGGAPPSSKNPAANTSDLTGIPIRLYYTSGDTICVPSTISAFDSALASCDSVQIGTGGHGTQTSFDMADVISFFAAHA